MAARPRATSSRAWAGPHRRHCRKRAAASPAAPAACSLVHFFAGASRLNRQQLGCCDVRRVLQHREQNFGAFFWLRLFGFRRAKSPPFRSPCPPPRSCPSSARPSACGRHEQQPTYTTRGSLQSRTFVNDARARGSTTIGWSARMERLAFPKCNKIARFNQMRIACIFCNGWRVRCKLIARVSTRGPRRP